MFHRSYLQLLFVLAVFALPAAAAAAETLRIEPTRFPFLPKLTVNERSALCEPYLAAYRAWYKSTEESFDYKGMFKDGAAEQVPGLAEVEWTRRPVGWEEKLTYSSIDWDVDVDGDLELILSVWSSRAGTEYHQIIVIDDREEFLASVANASTREFLKLKRELSNNTDLIVAADYNYDPAIMSFDGELLLYDDGLFSKFRIGANPTPICQLTHASLSFGGIHGRPAKAGEHNFPALSRYLRALSDFLGNPSYQCEGRMSTRLDGKRRRRLLSRLYNALSRPQALAIRPHPAQNGQGEPSSDGDSRQPQPTGSIFRYRTERAMKQGKTTAIAELTDWYMDAFGLPSDVAAATAAGVIDPALRAVLSNSFGGWYEVERYETLLDWNWREGLRRLEMGETVESEMLFGYLRGALLDGAGATEIARLMDAGAYDEAMRLYERQSANGGGAMETPIFLSLEHSELVVLLLDRGEDPNHRNYFGKTPLMYAAQFNLVETAEILLSRGADANLLTTQKPEPYCHKFRYIGRSALMYAAENADQRMMALLILGGRADTNARDQKFSGTTPRPGRSISDYLSRNENLTDAQRATIIARWNLE